MKRHGRAGSRLRTRPSPGEGSQLLAHQRRLRVAFGVLMLSLSGPAAIISACGGGQDGRRADGGPSDATSGTDAEAGLADAIAKVGDAGADKVAPLPCRDASDDSAALVCNGDGGLHGAPYERCRTPCYFFVNWACSTFARQNGCALSASDCERACGPNAGNVLECLYASSSCGVAAQPDGSFAYEMAETGPYAVACGICPAIGRRPAGLARPERPPAKTAMGGYFAEAAHLEAASIRAFRRLAQELSVHGAPAALRRAARRSELDEARHARVMTRLARRSGGEPPSVRIRISGTRRLERMALENVVEGCVRETFGAMIATWQAAHASDVAVRMHLRRIAADETRHAALAWAVSDWAGARLTPAARRRVARARAAAVERLQQEVEASTDPTLQREIGLPDSHTARQLLTGLTHALWA